MPADTARREVTKRRRHFNVSKTGFISQLGNDPLKTNPRDVLVDESKQADIENLGECLRALGARESTLQLRLICHNLRSLVAKRIGGESRP